MKKIFLLILLLSLTSCIQGDLNHDGAIDNQDSVRCLEFAVGSSLPTVIDMITGDMNGDGRINSADCAIIMRSEQK